MIYRIIKIAALALLLLLGTYNTLFTIIAFFISASIILFDDKSLYVMLFLHPFSTIFNLSPTGMSLMTILIIAYVIVDILKYKRLDAGFFILYILFALFVLILTANNFEATRTIKFLIGFLFVYFALQDAKRLDVKDLFMHFICGLLLSSAMVYLGVFHNLSAYFPENNTLGYNFGYVSRFSGLCADPNYFSVNITICLCLVVFLRINKMIRTGTQLLIAAALLVFCVLTFSKSAVLSLGIVLLVIVIYYFKQRKYEKAVGIIGLSVIGVLILLSLNIPSVAILVSRFQSNDDLNSFTTGRFDLWKTYLDFIATDFKVLFLGTGICADILSKGVHNTYLDSLYYLGIIGSLLLILLVIALNKKTTNGKKNIINASVFLSILFMYFGLSELFYFDFPIHLLLGSLILRAPVDPEYYEEERIRKISLQTNANHNKSFLTQQRNSVLLNSERKRG